MEIVPVVRGLFLCERVEADPVNKNLTLHNCFRSLQLSAIPGTPLPFFVVAYLANGSGKLRLRTTISAPLQQAEVFAHDAELAVTDRLAEVRFVLKVVCRFYVPGSYDISLTANGELVALTPFRVQLKEQP